jgi:hypothetical protein
MAEGTAVDFGDVIFDDLPLRAAVAAQRLAGISVDLYRRLMMKAGLLQAQRLTSGPRADLHRSQLTHDPSSAGSYRLIVPARADRRADPRRHHHEASVSISNS